MSRIGKKPIIIPEKVEAKIDGGFVIVKGPKGELKEKIHPRVKIEVRDNKEINISVADESVKEDNSLWGTFGSLIRSMIKGVTLGFEKKLEIVGIGYKAAVQGKNVVLNLGFSHPINFPIPEGINITVDKNTIIISGISKQLVGETAARIRGLREPEPYKGKGIKYSDEIIKKKAGKAAKAVGGAK